MMRTLTALLLTGALVLPGPVLAGESSKTATLFKNPQCDCCEAYAGYMRRDGFTVTVKPTHDLSLIRRMRGVPPSLEGCHTTVIDGYVIEGHVPLRTLNKFLSERPDNKEIKGISLPGMPQGALGMTGRKTGPFTIYEIGAGAPKVYAVE